MYANLKSLQKSLDDSEKVKKQLLDEIKFIREREKLLMQYFFDIVLNTGDLIAFKKKYAQQINEFQKMLSESPEALNKPRIYTTGLITPTK